jgi:hypothetical protein
VHRCTGSTQPPPVSTLVTPACGEKRAVCRWHRATPTLPALPALRTPLCKPCTSAPPQLLHPPHPPHRPQPLHPPYQPFRSYHNVVPVICASLQGDATRIRTAIIGGVSVGFGGGSDPGRALLAGRCCMHPAC